MVYIEKDRCVNCQSCLRACSMGVFVPGETAPEIHPRRRCIQCMHCAAACPRKAISFEELPREAVYPPEREDPLERLITTRRSVRRYRKEPPARELLQHALDLANYAPSGKNQRAYRFTVVYGKPAVEKLRDLCLSLCAEHGEAPELNKLFSKGTDLLTCGAPCMIVAWSPEKCLNPVLDPTVAMAELELLLVQAGLSTCWGGYLRQVSDRFPEIREALGLPGDCRVRCALMAGKAQGETYLRTVYRPPVEAVWLTEDGE